MRRLRLPSRLRPQPASRSRTFCVDISHTGKSKQTTALWLGPGRTGQLGDGATEPRRLCARLHIGTEMHAWPWASSRVAQLPSGPVRISEVAAQARANDGIGTAEARYR